MEEGDVLQSWPSAGHLQGHVWARRDQRLEVSTRYELIFCDWSGEELTEKLGKADVITQAAKKQLLIKANLFKEVK